MKKLIPLLFIVLVSCGELQIRKESSEWNESSLNEATETNSSLKIMIFDVGEGSASLIIDKNNSATLIDTGPKGSFQGKIASFIKDNGLTLENVIITHNDSDHNGALDEVKKSPLELNTGDIIYIDDETLIRVVAKNLSKEDDNGKSAVLLIERGKFRLLITGDLPGGGGSPPYDTIDMESEIANSVGDIDILIVGHHGSNTSTNETLLSETTPEVAVISVGNQNPFYHPHSSVVERLLQHGIKIYQTERGWLKNEFSEDVKVANGNVLIETDGNGYSFTTPTYGRDLYSPFESSP